MAKFNYTAKDKDGRTVKGEMDAGDKNQALNILREKGMLILKLEEVRGGASFSLGSIFSRRKVKRDDLVIFARQMATMTGAGITILNAIETMVEQVDHPGFKRILQDLYDSVNTGASLSEAMNKHLSVFSAYFVNMVRAGESSGKLDEVLDRVALYLEKSNAMHKKITSAMVYPAVVSGMAVVITLLMILKVIPVFADMFAGFGAQLPGPTQFLINLSNLMRHSFWKVLVVLAVLLVLIKRYISTRKGRQMLDGLKLRMPIFGTLLKKVAVSKFTRTLSTLVRSGVPILSALEIVAKTSGNVVVENTIIKVRDSVREGESIARPMKRSGIFPPLVTRMVAVGEKSGELETMLSKIADFYDEQVDAAVSALTSLIEPLVIAFLGIVIGGIVICMFLPIFQISTYIKM